MVDRPDRPALGPRTIAVAYLLFGGAWVAFSDHLVRALVANRTLYLQVQTLKGWVFVSLSGLLIFGLVARSQRRLERKNDSLERAVQQTTILHRILRHNLRNLGNVIRGYTDILEGTGPTTVPDAQCIEVIRSHTDELIRISEKSRHLQRAVFAEGVDPQPTDVAAMLDREVDRLRAAHPSVSIETRIRGHGWAFAADELSVALGELLENAVKHGSTVRRVSPDDAVDRGSTGRGTSSDHAGERGSEDGQSSAADSEPEETAESSVVVRLRDDGDSLVIEIEDDGPGLPRMERDVLENRVEEPLEHSSGLGLWIARTIVTELGGSLEVEDVPRGSVIRIGLEAAPGASDADGG